MRFSWRCFLCLALLCALSAYAKGDPAAPAPSPSQTSNETTSNETSDDTETIVAIRHGEKPPGGLGNVDCQGLNRALALPGVLLGKYGKPDYIFAPDPSEKADWGKYNYIRPLITIEPTAVRCELPINTAYGYTQIDQLAAELKKPEYKHSLIFIAWEHKQLDKFARLMVKAYGGNPAQVPAWPDEDFDSIFVFKISHQNGHDSLTFKVDHEGLNNLSKNCP